MYREPTPEELAEQKQRGEAFAKVCERLEAGILGSHKRAKSTPEQRGEASGLPDPIVGNREPPVRCGQISAADYTARRFPPRKRAALTGWGAAPRLSNSTDELQPKLSVMVCDNDRYPHGRRRQARLRSSRPAAGD
jgi:hypothetical protein